MAVLPPDPVYILKTGDMGYIHSLCFPMKSYSNYCSQLLAATEKGFVHFWDLETNRQQHKQQMGESIQTVHSFDDNIVTQEKSGLVKLWSIKKSSYTMVESYKCSEGFCKSIILNSCLVVPQNNNCVDLLDVKDLQKVKQLVPDRENLGHITCLEEVVIGESVCILAGYESGDIIMWDIETAQPCGHLKLRENITALTFDPATGRGVAGNSSHILELFTIDKSFNMTLKAELSITNNGCNVVKLRPFDQKIFVCGGWDGRLRIFSWKTFRILVILTEHKEAITDVQWSSNIINLWKANIMAASSADGTISLWNLYN